MPDHSFIRIANCLRVVRDGIALYKGSFPSKIAAQVTQVHVFERSVANHVHEIREVDGQEGYQRPALKSRQKKFAEYLSRHGEATAFSPPIVLNARGCWTFEPSGESEHFGALHVTGPANVIDGQHRLGGFIAHFEEIGESRSVDFIAYEQLDADQEKLILCPTTLVANWEAELRKWAPELGVAVMSPPGRIREASWRALAWRRHVLITNYEQMRDPPAALQSRPPDLLVADEAQRIRKRTAKATAGVMSLEPERFWALSGTPLERDRDDLVTLLSLIEPRRFSARDAHLHPTSLRAQARPYILRRRKDEVLDDLPRVRDTTERIELTPAQRRAYDEAITRYRSRPGDGHELALLTRLRELCDLDPATGASSKADRILELLARIREQGEKAVVFALLLKPLHYLKQRIEKAFGRGACRLLVGEMGVEERDRAVREFRTEPGVFALLASTRVGGEGLTLVEANHAFHFDQWWRGGPQFLDSGITRIAEG